jgi:hypothetical protein
VRKKRTLLICAACALLALIALMAYTSATAEPSYDGHPLNYWVAILGDPSGLSSRRPDFDKATNAIDHIGAAALPFLVKWIRGFPPQWKVQLSKWTARPWLQFANRLCNASIMRANRLYDGSGIAFQVLREKAMPAFDDLCRLMNETNTPLTSFAAMAALCCIGTNAIPPLLAVAANTNHPFHIQAQLSADIVSQRAPAPSPPAH